MLSRLAGPAAAYSRQKTCPRFFCFFVLCTTLLSAGTRQLTSVKHAEVACKARPWGRWLPGQLFYLTEVSDRHGKQSKLAAFFWCTHPLLPPDVEPPCEIIGICRLPQPLALPSTTSLWAFALWEAAACCGGVRGYGPTM